ncbi:MAG: amidohydrolase family protein [Spirochaetota bacterium]
MRDGMTVVDEHVHLFQSDALASRILSVFNSKYSIKFENTGGGTDTDLIAHMDMHGIDYSIVANFSSAKHVDANNRWTLELGRISPRLIPLISFHPDMPAFTTDILDDYISLGAKGIKLHPMAQEFDPMDKRIYPFYKYAGKKKLPVVFHCGRVSNARLNAYSDANKIFPIIEMFPDTDFILTHMVDGNEQDLRDIAGRCRNVFFDTSIVVTGYDQILETNIPSWRNDSQCIKVFREVGMPRFVFG